MTTSCTSRIIGTLLGMAIATFAGTSAATDEWDAAAVKDNTAATTRNEIQRGERQSHDLQSVSGVADEDWFVVPTSAYRSFQVFVSEVTGDTPIDNADFLELYDAAGTTLIASATAGPGATGKVIRWFSDATTSFRIRVKGGTATPGTARYSILFTESTMYCPRYNNAGTQISVLIVQNATNGSCGVGVNFYDETGAYLASHTGTINGSGMMVLPVGSVPGLVGTKGSVRIEGTFCSSSALKAKMVALEPATGFSFDTLCERR